jgi:hypothetical protein
MKPFGGNALGYLFSTHPSTENELAALRALGLYNHRKQHRAAAAHAVARPLSVAGKLAPRMTNSFLITFLMRIRFPHKCDYCLNPSGGDQSLVVTSQGYGTICPFGLAMKTLPIRTNTNMSVENRALRSLYPSGCGAQLSATIP